MVAGLGAGAILLLLAICPAAAQEQSSSSQPPPAPRFSTLKFLAGGALGLAIHESGHVVFDLAFNAHPRLTRVALGGVPFFAITHRQGLSPRREYIIDTAGFWTQDVTSERFLSRRPSLTATNAPIATGEFAFDEVTSIGYGVVAFARTGPPQRDTRGMAAALRVGEPIVGAMVIAPALLDGYRYFKPDSRWAKWTSRAVKIGTVLLVLK
jgi:hypothetical protein